MTKTFEINGRKVGAGCPAYIIAEVGSNHDTSLVRAKELAGAAKDAGADAFKMQSFTAEGLLNPLMPDASGAWGSHPAYPVLERLAVPEQWHYELMDYSEKIGITFLSAPFEAGRAALLEKIGVHAYKIASGDVTDEPLLRQIAGYSKPILLSTGASYLEEVRRAFDILTEGGSAIALLHCAALYPPHYDEVNLRAMVTLAKEFGCPVGFSDHTPGSVVPVAAVALGASVIEKHITFDRSLPGPDHPYAMEVGEFASMVADIRNIESALGDGVKKPSAHEEEMRVIARRSIYASRPIKKGSVITPAMVKVVRQMYGLEPAELDGVIGATAARDISVNMPVRRDDICA